MSSHDAQASIEALLTDDHREIDELFERAQAGDAAALASFKERLRLHMKLEEELLFPAFAGTPLAVPCVVMTREHDQLRRLLEVDDFAALAATLGAHNMKEERVIYPQCQDARFAPVTPKISAGLGAGS